jgi:hypothetical protein
VHVKPRETSKASSILEQTIVLDAHQLSPRHPNRARRILYDFPVLVPASVELLSLVLTDPAGDIPHPEPVAFVAEPGPGRNIPVRNRPGWADHA